MVAVRKISSWSRAEWLKIEEITDVLFEQFNVLTNRAINIPGCVVATVASGQVFGFAWKIEP